MAGVTISDPKNLEIARRAVLDLLHEDLGYAAEQVDELRQAAWPPGIVATDVRATFRHLAATLETMEALGWPEPDVAPREAS